MSATPEQAKAGSLRLVFDTTVLSNFSAVAQVGLLERLYRDSAGTTLMVAEEIQRGIDSGYEYLRSAAEGLAALHVKGWLVTVPLESAEEQSLYTTLSASLGAGEASCLSVAITRGLTLATDDLAARRMAAGRGLRMTGTLGVLVRLVREGHLSLPMANGLLARMIVMKFRSPVERLDDLI